MISISDIIWGDKEETEINPEKETANIQFMEYTCLEMCCAGGKNWYDSPTSYIGCK